MGTGGTYGAAIVAGGPIVWGVAIFATIVVGAEEIGAGMVTFDCWKNVVRDSTTKNMFVTLDELLLDERVAGYDLDERSNSMVVRNKWNETFAIEEAALPCGFGMPHGKL